jgi:hypothetical protein
MCGGIIGSKLCCEGEVYYLLQLFAAKLHHLRPRPKGSLVFAPPAGVSLSVKRGAQLMNRLLHPVGVC